MSEDFITFETAKLAKEKGLEVFFVDEAYNPDGLRTSYNWGLTKGKQGFPHWQNSFARPTQAHLQKWLREKHGIFIKIECHFAVSDGFSFYITKSDGIVNSPMFYECGFKTCEKALEQGLQQALELI